MSWSGYYRSHSREKRENANSAKIDSKNKLIPTREGPLGYDWLDKIGQLSERRYINDLGEILNLSARCLNDYDACVTFASSYLNLDTKEVADVLDILIKNDFISTK